MRHYCSAYAVCPFYIQEDNQKIYCEGVEIGTGVHLAFQLPEDKNTYRNRYCCNIDNYENCRIADMLNLKHLMEGG